MLCCAQEVDNSPDGDCGGLTRGAWLAGTVSSAIVFHTTKAINQPELMIDPASIFNLIVKTSLTAFVRPPLPRLSISSHKQKRTCPSRGTMPRTRRRWTRPTWRRLCIGTYDRAPRAPPCMPGSIFLTGRLSIPQLIRPPWASALRLGVKSIHLIDPGHGRPAKQIHDWMKIGRAHV